MNAPIVTATVAVLALGSFAELATAQDRLQRFIDGPVTREAVTRSLAVVPENAGDPDGPVELSVMLRISFGFDSAELTGQARRDLDSVAEALNDPQLAGARLTLEGHTDATGTAGYNLRLSHQRAEAVVSYLILRGVARERLRPAGFGERPVRSTRPPTTGSAAWRLSGGSEVGYYTYLKTRPCKRV